VFRYRAIYFLLWSLYYMTPLSFDLGRLGRFSFFHGGLSHSSRNRIKNLHYITKSVRLSLHRSGVLAFLFRHRHSNGISTLYTHLDISCQGLYAYVDVGPVNVAEVIFHLFVRSSCVYEMRFVYIYHREILTMR